MVFLLLFQTYRFPKIQQGTGNGAALCSASSLLRLSPPCPRTGFFFSRACLLAVIITQFIFFNASKKCQFFQVLFFACSKQKKAFLYDALKCLLGTLLKSVKVCSICSSLFSCLDSI